jgi:hypothetical protein
MTEGSSTKTNLEGLLAEVGLKSSVVIGKWRELDSLRDTTIQNIKPD